MGVSFRDVRDGARRLRGADGGTPRAFEPPVAGGRLLQREVFTVNATATLTLDDFTKEAGQRPRRATGVVPLRRGGDCRAIRRAGSAYR
jgi:hypothetical protein